MTMLDRYTPAILRVTGGATMLGVVVFLAPAWSLRLLGLSLDAGAELLVARHWGVLVCCVGGLLVYSSRKEALRAPVLCVAAIEKLVFVAMVASGSGGTPSCALRFAASFDGGSVMLFAVLLLRHFLSRG